MRKWMMSCLLAACTISGTAQINRSGVADVNGVVDNTPEVPEEPAE